MAWEYKIVTASGEDEDDEDILNELGGEGWELVTALQSEVFFEVETEDGEEEAEETAEIVVTFYLKRQK
ncbi:MAG: DUF4177 domain-containing protein [Armatimonadota bacterium]